METTSKQVDEPVKIKTVSEIQNRIDEINDEIDQIDKRREHQNKLLRDLKDEMNNLKKEYAIASVPEKVEDQKQMDVVMKGFESYMKNMFPDAGYCFILAGKYGTNSRLKIDSDKLAQGIHSILERHDEVLIHCLMNLK